MKDLKLSFDLKFKEVFLERMKMQLNHLVS